ncbi:ZIP family metal transporter [Gimesia aquarii]|uniref:Zinc transporter ZupT n=1 Tax=Gimesia aquarii TaxID=2527964 RepID=A0A517W438_9PLAN|nr:ZIP family metal transporter [Gimesia aquarii]QDU00017.1 zinc transporter ZupT [Gimesia aquarii]
MKPLSHFKNDVKLTLLLMTIPLVLFLIAPGFFVSQPTLAAEHTHQHAESENTSESSTVANADTKAPNSIMWAYTLLGVYCSVIVFSSLLGGWLPSLIRLTHTRMETLISFVGGLMLGIGVFHLLPHAVAEMGSVDRAVWWMMAGILTLFFLIRTFHFHQHGTVELDEENEHEHDHDCDHHHAHAHVHPHTHSHKLSWVGIALGLALHTLIDGLALGASIIAEQHHEVFLSLFGLGTFLAITLHKPLDAVSITSLMAAGGWSAGWRNAVNIGFALMCPLGALLFFLGVQQFSENQHIIIGCALAFSAGVFICISLGDLLPEMEFHSHNRFRLSFVLLLGIALAYGIGFIEPDHVHHHGSHGADSSNHEAEHSHNHSH